MNNRKKIIIIVLLVVFLGLLALLFFRLFRSSVPTETPSGEEPGTVIDRLPTGPSSGTTTPGDKPRNYQQYDISQEQAHQKNGDDLGKLAMFFAERFGSFSNQSEYGNFTDLKLFMTDELKTWVDKYVSDLKAKEGDPLSYYGISTQAVSYKVKSFDDKAGKGEIVVSTSRRESREEIGGGTAFNQDISLVFLKVNNEWLVDQVYWQK